jgi:hypothetical protein
VAPARKDRSRASTHAPTYRFQLAIRADRSWPARPMPPFSRLPGKSANSTLTPGRDCTFSWTAPPPLGRLGRRRVVPSAPRESLGGQARCLRHPLATCRCDRQTHDRAAHPPISRHCPRVLRVARIRRRQRRPPETHADRQQAFAERYQACRAGRTPGRQHLPRGRPGPCRGCARTRERRSRSRPRCRDSRGRACWPGSSFSRTPGRTAVGSAEVAAGRGPRGPVRLVRAVHLV